MLDCVIVCLLATEVNIRTAYNDSSCGYCVDARSTHEHCFKNVIECAYMDPEGIIFCMNFFETEESGEMITKTTRCLSYRDILIPDRSIIDIVENGNCHYRDRQFCDCSACPNRNVSNGGKLNYQPTTPSTTLLPRVASSESAAIGQMKDSTARPSRVDYPSNTFLSFFERAKMTILRFFFPEYEKSAASGAGNSLVLSLSCLLVYKLFQLLE